MLRRRVTDRSHEVSVSSSAVDGGGDNGGRGAGSKSVGEGDIAGRSRSRVGRARDTSAQGRRHNQDGGGNDRGAVVVGTLGVEDVVVVAGFTKSRQSGHEGIGDLVEQHGEGLVDVSKAVSWRNEATVPDSSSREGGKRTSGSEIYSLWGLEEGATTSGKERQEALENEGRSAQQSSWQP